MAGRDAPLPNITQARRLVVSLGVFWGLWAVAAIIYLTGAAAAFAITLVPALAAGWFFYYTVYDVWRDRTGRSPLRMLLFPGFRGSLVAHRALFTLLRPSWFVPALRATGWSVWRVGSLLGGLLVLDLVLFVVATVLGTAHHATRTR